jgi:serine/threonine-protein kinase
LELTAQVASALDVAHRVGIVHRDIKPENVFRAHGSDGPRWVVLDFGVSKVKGGTGTLTGGGVVGTPRYMAPEQARGASVDPRADVFSLGAILYRCLTGRVAFDADDPLGALVQVMGEQPLRPSAIVDLIPDVELVLALALAKDPARRIASVAGLVGALAAAARGELAEDLRARAREVLRTTPWNEPEHEAITMRPGAWMYESGEQRVRTAPFPEHLSQDSLPPPPPFRERDDSVTHLAEVG